MSSKIEYKAPQPGPRDAEHRRVAQVTDGRFVGDEKYTDEALAALVQAIEGLGGTVTLPARQQSISGPLEG